MENGQSAENGQKPSKKSKPGNNDNSQPLRRQRRRPNDRYLRHPRRRPAFGRLTPMHGFKFLSEAASRSEKIFWAGTMFVFGAALAYMATTTIIDYSNKPMRTTEQVYTGDYKMTEPIALEMSLGQFSDCQLYTQKSTNLSNFWLTAALSAVVNASVIEWSDPMLVEYLSLANGGDEHRDCVDPDALRWQLSQIEVVGKLQLWRLFENALLRRFNLTLTLETKYWGDRNSPERYDYVDQRLQITDLKSSKMSLTTVSPITIKAAATGDAVTQVIVRSNRSIITRSARLSSTSNSYDVSMRIGEELFSYDSFSVLNRDYRHGYVNILVSAVRQFYSVNLRTEADIGRHGDVHASYAQMTTLKRCANELYHSEETPCVAIAEIEENTTAEASICELDRYAGHLNDDAYYDKVHLVSKCVLSRWQAEATKQWYFMRAFWRGPEEISDVSVIYKFGIVKSHVIMVTETHRITLVNLISELGGIFGVYFGASLISFIHVLVFLSTTAREKLVKKKKSAETTPDKAIAEDPSETSESEEWNCVRDSASD